MISLILNLQEGIEINKNITKLLNKEGRWFSELIYRLLMENGNSYVQPNLDVIMGLFEKEKKKLTKPMIKGFDLSGLELPKNVEVKELISEYDLAYAGRTLKNCLNNPGQDYKKKIKSGKTKVFVIITPGSMSALELRKVDSLTWNEVYLLSYCNKVCNQYHRNIGEFIKAYYHKELVLSGVSEVLSTHERAMERAKRGFSLADDSSTADNDVDHGGLMTPVEYDEDIAWDVLETTEDVEESDDVSFSATTSMNIVRNVYPEDIDDDDVEMASIRRDLDELQRNGDRRVRTPNWGDGDLPF
jgi:hypothetical protein